MDDLPLFAWTPPKRMLIFPANRWTGKARHVAEKFVSQKTDRARQRYWTQIVGRMIERLANAGADPDDVQAQIALFREAVQHEIDHLAERSQVQDRL